MKRFEHDQLMYAQGEAAGREDGLRAGRLAEIKNTEIMNLFISSLILIFYVCGGMKLISPYKNNSVCIFLFNNADKNNDAGTKRND